MAGVTLPPHDVADLTLAGQGRRRVEFAERDMPVLGLLRARFARERPLAGLRVALCAHVTPETACLAGTLAAGGAELHLAASNPLSTQDDVAAALVVDDSVGVHARYAVDRAGCLAHLSGVLDSRPQLLLDDGCDLVAMLHTTRTDLLGQVRAGGEQTSTGVLRLRQMAADGALRLPMAAVNDTPMQLLVANRHGTGQSTLDAVMRATGILLAGTTVIVAGYGWCGTGIARRATGLGARVVVTEVEPSRALEAVLDGHRVLPMAEAALLGDVFVTTTGNRDVLTTRHFAVMKDGAVLANAGHFDVEVDVVGLASEAVAVHRRVRPHVDAYELADGRRLLLLAEGRLANLAAGEGHPPSVMDISFAVQALTVEWLAGAELAPGVHRVPAAIDEEVARTKLDALGVRLDLLTPAQDRYLSSWRP
ncbi:MAG: adenosylhomocysteinase [Actinobacteria bacterium]|nr:adenosylhomocysteinase [Actinomycetota bacterium]MBW3648500.1 adenosylhomocysteinase [Actinomycetota bacterium]